MCPSIDKTQNSLDINDAVNLRNKLDADYYTVYLGITMDLKILNRKNNIKNDATEI